MRLHATSKLMWQPLPLVVLFVVVPVSVIGLFAKMPSASDVIGIAALVGVGIGLIVGVFLSGATNSTFAPVLPGFVRDLGVGAAVAGLATAGLIGLVCVIGGCVQLALPAWGVSLALFSLGCMGASPTWLRLEGVIIFLVTPFVLNHVPWSALAHRGWFTAIGGTAFAAAVMQLTFSRRRWFRERAGAGTRAARTPRSPVTERARHRRLTAEGPDVFRDLWAISPRGRVRHVVPWFVLFAVPFGMRWLTPYEPGHTWWIALGAMVAGLGEWLPNRLRAGLPWSRLRHLRATYLEQVFRTLWFVGVLAPLLITARYAGSSSHPVPGDLLRGVVVCATCLPLFILPHGPAPTAPRLSPIFRSVLTSVLWWVPAFVMPAVNLASRLVPAIIQTLILAAIFAWVQGWYWLYLRHHFAQHDLDGNDA